MKVKIGDVTYDDNTTPIMLILTPQDKRNLSHMPQGILNYISHPGELTQEQVNAWASTTADNQSI